MKLRKVRIRGFQSFADSGDIEFTDGFNLVIGQNNGGKSALLRALQSNLIDDRHRTPERWAGYELPEPEVHMSLEVNGEELRKSILRFGQQFFPMSLHSNPEEFAESLFSGKFEFNIVRSPSGVVGLQYPSHNMFTPDPNYSKFAVVVTSVNGRVVANPGRVQSDNDTLPILLDNMWSSSMFFFSAERMTIGESGHGFAERLNPNASNLPAVLLTLSGNQGDVFAKLVRHLRDIFSTVGNLSVAPMISGNIEIRVWPTQAMERVELSFPLNSSGTGVSQVIAILTAIMTSYDAVIIIDEINSFLHPAAVKALLRILQTEYSQHQYIISTHAPEVIGFSNPKTIYLVKRDGYNSLVDKLELREVNNFREVADHLGVSMADVFAAEKVIWVEGPTEELIFPYIYEKVSGNSVPRGTIFTAVAATGDFNRKRDRAIVYEVYNRLSAAAVTLVVAVVFSFDSEELADTDKESMMRDAGGRLMFLPRRHIECYLIDPAAIASMIVSKDPQSAIVVSAERVRAVLNELAGEKRFHVREWSGDLTSETWLAKVDAANLIAQATVMLSEQRVTFNKKEDSLGLVKNIISRDPAKLEPLYKYVYQLVGAVNNS